MAKILDKMIIFLALAGSAYAYIDPGTAGTIIGGSIWPFIVTIAAAIGAFFVKYLIGPVKNLFRKGKKK